MASKSKNDREKPLVNKSRWMGVILYLVGILIAYFILVPIVDATISSAFDKGVIAVLFAIIVLLYFQNKKTRK